MKSAIPLTEQAQWTVAQSDLGNPDRATGQTVAIMCRHIRNACADPLVQAAAWDAVTHWAQKSDAGPGAIALAAFWWTKHKLTFIHHQKLLLAWLNKVDALQLLISPDVVVRTPQPVGDCAIYVMMECAILRCFDVPFEVVTVAVDPSQPNDFTHVYARAVMPNGDRVNLDASHGPAPGWRVPDARVSRQKVWDESGNEIGDAGAGPGLGDYVARGLGACGDCLVYDDVEDTCDTYDTSGCGSGNTTSANLTQGGPLYTFPQSSVPPAGAYTDSAGNTCPPGSPNCYVLPSWASTSGGAPPSSSTTSLDTALANLGNSWTKIFGQILAPQTTIIGPNGTIITGPAGSTSVTSAASSALSALSPTTLIIGAVLIGGLLLIGKK